MTNFINKIIHADCLEILEQLPDESIDAVITDPPYNIGKADWDIWKTPQNYFDFMSICFGRFERVLKPNGSFYFFHNNMPFISELMQILKLTKFYFISFVVVHKVNHRKKTWKTKKTKLRSWFNVCDYLLHYVKLEGNNQNSTGLEQIYNNPECFKSIKQYMKDERDKIIKDKGFKTLAEFNNYINKVTETKSVVSRHYFSDSQYFFPTEEIYKKMQTTGYFQREYKGLREEYESSREEYKGLREEYENLRYRFNIVNNENSNVWRQEKINNSLEHPTKKDEKTMQKIILSCTNIGETILDPFCGSGTTLVEAIKINRNFIGIEQDYNYHKIAVQNIIKTTNQLRLFDENIN